MLTYQVRQRGCYTEPLGTPLTFPAAVSLTFHLAPQYPFGGPPEPCNTAKHGDPVRLHFDSNTGRSWAMPSTPIESVDALIKGNDGTLRCEGHRVTVRTHCESREQLERLLEGYYYILPIILNIDFVDAPVVELVSGTVETMTFSWGILSPDTQTLDVTTSEIQEQRVVRAMRRVALFHDEQRDGRRRVLAALHWFQVACRLARVGHSPWEFLAEELLNFAKILEVLFPASGDEKTIDAARRGLTQLGFSTGDIEAHYVPALALRNKLDVAHVSLAIFSQEQLQVLHKYAAQAEDKFRLLLTRVLEGLEAGSFVLHPYDGGQPSSSATQVIERIRALQEPKT